MKKVLLLIILIISCFTINVNAQDKTTFSISKVAASPGNEVTVTVNMRDNPNFQTLSFFVPLNSLLVEYESCSVIGFDGASMKNCGLNPRNEITFYAFMVSKNDDKFFTNSGDILNIKLKVKDGVKEDILLKLTDVSFYGTGDLEYNLEDGLIKTTGEIENTVINSNEDLSKKVDKDKEVTWESSNSDVAKVDKDGKVSFRESGNTTITAKDKNGKTIYEKTYNVNKKKDLPIGLFIGIGIVAVGIIVLIVLIATKKIKINFKKKKESI